MVMLNLKIVFAFPRQRKHCFDFITFFSLQMEVFHWIFSQSFESFWENGRLSVIGDRPLIEITATQILVHYFFVLSRVYHSINVVILIIINNSVTQNIQYFNEFPKNGKWSFKNRFEFPGNEMDFHDIYFQDFSISLLVHNFVRFLWTEWIYL